MSNKVPAHIFRVFVDEKGEFGNPVGIVVDEGQKLTVPERQKITLDLGFSEVVFINDLKSGKVSIFNPQEEVAFAGHALIGTVYFISQVLGKPITSLECKVGKVKFWQEGDLTWIQASLEGTPPWHRKQLETPAQVENLSQAQIVSFEHTIVWAWVDKEKGIVRARTFAPDWGIPEDQGNGSGSMQLAAMLSKKLEIHHGEGSVIFVKPDKNAYADVGGKVVKDMSIRK